MPITARSRRARIRRTSALVLVASGLTLSATAVASAQPQAASASAPAAVDVVGLKKGAYGEAVKALQLALVRVGVGVKYGVDSYFGSATQASVKAFQRYKGLPVTGVVDQATAAALGLAPAPAPAAVAAAPGTLARGAIGQPVKQLQQALINAGVTVPGGVDGIFGRGTEGALKTFQQSKGLGVTGTVDPRTAAALSLGGNPAPQPAAAGVSGPATATIGLRLGSRGPAVVSLQQALLRMGWTLRGGADGIFGTATQSVLLVTQRSNGIRASGTVDEATARLLGLSGSATAAAPAAPAPATTAAGFANYDERGARVVALQTALIRAGITVPGGADGVFGASTAGAIMSFQRARGLNVSGKVDDATAAALGLSAAPAPAAAPAINIQLEAKPLQGPCYYGDTWSAARGNGRIHLGVDIAAAEGNQLYAVATGRISQIYTDSPGSLSGNGLKIARPDGTYFFYAHLSQLAPGIALGTPVTAGQVVGYVGHTGNAGGPHLHLEVHPGGGSAVNPYPIVRAIGAC